MNSNLEEVKNGKYIIAIHNGYDGYSYGCPRDPMVLDYDEYKRFVGSLQKLGLDRMFVCFEMGGDFDMLIPDNVRALIGDSNRIFTITNNESLIFSSDDVKKAREKEKISLLEQLTR